MVRPGASPEAGGAVARLRGDAEPSAAGKFEVGKPAPYYCKACQAVPQEGYCRMAGCPTAPARSLAQAAIALHQAGYHDLGEIVDRVAVQRDELLAELKWCLMGCGDRERIARLIAEAEGK